MTLEEFGSGFKRINSLCKDAGCKYSYENSELGFTFILYRSDSNNVTVNVADNVTLNKTEQSVLAILSKHSDYTRAQIAESISKTVRTVQRVLDSLREKGLIERVGSDKDGYWRVKE